MINSPNDQSAVLATYTSEQVEQAAELLQVEIRARDDRARSAAFVFLHNSGAWWTCCPGSGQWHRHIQGEWIPGSPPAGLLLGPAWVSHLVVFGEDGDPIDDDEMDLEAVVDRQRSTDGCQTLAMAVAQIQDSFAAGRLDSRSAEMVLRRLYLLDQEWRVWTVGVRSGRWYRLTGQGWDLSRVVPEGTPAFDETEYSQRIFEAQMPIIDGDAPALPETIVPVWQPPQGLQPAVETGEPVPCADCGDWPDRSPVTAELTIRKTDTAAPPTETATEQLPAEPVPDPPGALKPRRRSRRRLWLICIAAVLIPAAFFLAFWLDYHVFVTPDEMYERGDNFRTGWKAKKDPAKAYKWLDKAHRLGHPAATYSLGRMYQEGFGVQRDYYKAYKLYMVAAVNYNVDAMLALAGMYEQGLHVPVDHRKANEWRERARITTR